MYTLCTGSVLSAAWVRLSWQAALLRTDCAATQAPLRCPKYSKLRERLMSCHQTKIGCAASNGGPSVAFLCSS
jgi:hypothetical protein